MKRGSPVFGRSSWLLLPVLVAATLPATAAVAQSGNLIVSETAGGPPQPQITLEATEGLTEATRVLYVRRTEATEGDLVSFHAAVPGVTIEAGPPGGASGTLDLSDGERILLLHASAIPAGSHEGQLIALSDTGDETVASIVVVGGEGALPDPAVRVVEARDGDFTAVVSSAIFSRTLTVRSLAPRTLSLEVETTDLIDDGSAWSAPMDATSDQPLELKRGESLQLTLSATLPQPGNYTGLLRILTEGRQLDVEVSVAWPAEALAVAVSADDVRHDRAAEIPIEIQLRETAQRGQQIPRPNVNVSLQTDEGAFQQPQASFRTDAAFPLAVAPGQSRALAGWLSGSLEPGRYEVDIVFGSGDTPAEVKLEVFVRDPLWLATMILAAGIGTGALARLFQGPLRERLLARSTLRDLKRRAKAAARRAATPDREVADSVANDLGQLGALPAVLRRPPAADELHAQLLRVSVLETYVELAKRAREHGLFDAHAGDFARVEDYVRSGPTTADAAKTAMGTLNELRRSIQSALDLLASAQALRLAVHSRIQEPGTDGATVARLATIVNQVDSAVSAARTAGAEAARQVLEAARGDWRSFLLDELTAALDAPREQFVDATAWETLIAGLRSGINSARGMRVDSGLVAYEAMALRYIDFLADSLVDRARARAMQAISDGNENFAGKLLEAASLAEAARESARTGQLGAARVEYQRALKAFRELIPQDHSPGARRLRTASLPGVAVARTEDVPALPEARLPDIDFAYVTWSFLNVATYALALVIGVLLGLVVIYWPNATWGGPFDYAAAFLWGAGVHAVSSNTFGGVGGIVKDFRGS